MLSSASVPPASPPGRLVAIVVGLLSAAGAAPTDAAELHADGRLRQQFEYDSNITLRDGGDDAFGSRTLVGLLLGARTPAVQLALDGRVRVVRFTTDRDLDSEDFALDGTGRWEWRRSVLDLGAGVLRDTTRELLDQDGGQFTEENIERLTVNVDSSLSHRFTPLDTGTIGFNYRKQIFPSLSNQRSDRIGLEEFSFYGASGRWTRQLSPALAVKTLIGGSHFDSDSSDSVSIQGQLGADYQLTPTLSIGGTVGPTIVNTNDDESGGSDTTVGALWDINASYQHTANAEVVARFFQGLNPQSSGGALNFRTGLQIDANYQVTPRISVSLPALVQRQDPIDDDAGTSDTRYYVRVQPTLSYKLTRQLVLETSYRFRWQAFDDDDDGAAGHALLVSLAYDLPGLLSSR